VFEPFETLVNQYIVNHKITQTVKHNSQTYEEFVIQTPSTYSKKVLGAKKLKKDIIRSKILAYFVGGDRHGNTTSCITYLWVHHVIHSIIRKVLRKIKKISFYSVLKSNNFFKKVRII
jgi:hypothetical protein